MSEHLFLPYSGFAGDISVALKDTLEIILGVIAMVCWATEPGAVQILPASKS
jgi:hypothetical protein